MVLGTSWRATGRGYDVTLHTYASYLIRIPEQTVYPTEEFRLILMLKLTFFTCFIIFKPFNIKLEKYKMNYKGLRHNFS